jgi:CheY-like chemotaxis protein
VSTRFGERIALPAMANPPAPTAPQPPARPGAPERPKFEALVVEDNAINQMLAAALLDRLGIASTVVADGEQALERLQARRWDVVLMDCQMPVMDGYEAIRRWREMEHARGLPRTPVIALTANAMEGDRDRCLAAGMDDYLSKPIDRAALAARLATWLPG